MPRFLAILWLLGAVGAGSVRPAHAEAEACASCDPAGLVEQARAEMQRAIWWQGFEMDPAFPEPESALFAAAEESAHGRTARALPHARSAAARCFLSGREECAETYALLAELQLTAGAGEEAEEREALAFLSLVPWEALSTAQCQRAAVLRYRLAERLTPRRAQPAWADRCGALGKTGELGYRAAKAALIRGDAPEALARLELLRRHGSEHVLRSAYLVAVSQVVSGDLKTAMDGFEALFRAPPDPERRPEEQDARILAGLQLARLWREAGDKERALDVYREIPGRATARPEALLEGAVVAASLGDLGSARLYLETLEEHYPGRVPSLEVKRLSASVAVVDGDEDTARDTFRLLTEAGTRLRERYFDKPAGLEAELRADPSLGGLLDPAPASRLFAVEDALRDAQEQLADGRARVAALRALLEGEGPVGPLRDALEQLEGADALLRRAERLSARKAAAGTRLAGPAEAALRTARETAALRAELGRHMDETRAALARQTKAIAARLGALVAELDGQEASLEATLAATAPELKALRGLLFARARAAVERLEMSADVGDIELAWRKKQRATLEIERVHAEYDDALGTLAADEGEAKAEVAR
jgi:tetratricopeptide (TPR) repeat protein